MVPTGGSYTGLHPFPVGDIGKWANLQHETEEKTRVGSYTFLVEEEGHFAYSVSSEGEWDSDCGSPTESPSINGSKLTGLQQANQEAMCSAVSGNVCNFVDGMPSDDKWADKLGSPTFYTATASLPARCWEMSKLLDDSDKQEYSQSSGTVEVGFERSLGSEGHAAAGWIIGGIDHRSSFSTEGCEPAVCKQVNKISKVRRSLSNPQKFSKEIWEDKAIQNESTKANGVWEPSYLKRWGTFSCRDTESQVLTLDHDGVVMKNGIKVQVNTAPALDRLSLECEANLRCSCSTVQDGKKLLALDIISLPDHDICDKKNSLPPSPAYQTPNRGPNGFSHVEKLTGSCNSSCSHQTMLSGFDWRSKRRTASLSNNSTIRALDALFIASQLNSHREAGLLDMPLVEKLELESCFLSKEQDRVSGASSNHLNYWQTSVNNCSVPLSKSSNQQKGTSFISALQVDPNVRNKPNTKIVRSPSAKRCLPLSSDTSPHHLPGSLFERPMAQASHRKHKSEAGFSCNPSPVQSMPAPRGAPSCGRFSGPVLNRDSSLPKTSRGNLRRFYQGGVPCYTLLLDKSERMLIARGHRVSCLEKDNCGCMYTFLSAKMNPKGAWMTLGRKDKAAADVVGKMKVCSSLHTEVTSEGKTTVCLESEFVLLNGAAQMQHSKPPCMDKPKQPASLSHEKRASNAPRGHPISMPPVHISPLIIPMEHLHEKMEDTKMGNVGFESLKSPLKIGLRRRPSFSQEPWSDLDLPDIEPEFLGAWPSHLEHAAIVIIIPIVGQNCRSSWGKISKESGGWGLSFLYKSLERNMSSEARDISGSIDSAAGIKGQGKVMGNNHLAEVTGATSGQSTASEISSISGHLAERSICEGNISRYKGTNRRNASRLGSNRYSTTENDYGAVSKGLVKIPSTTIQSSVLRVNGPRKHLRTTDGPNVTVVLPAGEHGLPVSGGPSSLIERWESGGACHCGGWDMGCGLTVLSTERPSLYAARNSGEISTSKHVGLLGGSGSLRLFSQGRKQHMGGVFSLEVAENGSFLLDFEAPLSEVQAFAIAVATLHGQQTGASKGLESKPIDQSKEPSFMVNQSGFKLSDPPEAFLSPFERV